MRKWNDCNRHSIFGHPGTLPILVFLSVWCILIACGVGFCCEQCQFLAAHGRPTMNIGTPATHFNHIPSSAYLTPQVTAKPTPAPVGAINPAASAKERAFVLKHQTASSECPNIPNFTPGKKVTIGGYTGVTVFTTSHCPALLVMIPIKDKFIDHTKATPKATSHP